MNPFLKWPGGKHWLITKHKNLFPNNYQRYIEPFLGGGSVFFSLLPSNSILADINPGLINLYTVMRDHPHELKEILIRHQENHNADYFYQVRANVPEGAIEQAGRFLYLNRSCYNGMYRVNQNGGFNVPIGTKTSFIYDIDKFDEYAKALIDSVIIQGDFSPLIQNAINNDLIFVDPPYTIAHNQNSFIKYNERLFTWADQERLLNDLCIARNNNAIIFATNANYHLIHDMYKEQGFFIKTIYRYSSISGKTDKRCIQEELLITSIKLEG